MFKNLNSEHARVLKVKLHNPIIIIMWHAVRTNGGLVLFAGAAPAPASSFKPFSAADDARHNAARHM